jgi:hypothetical protein
MAKYQNGEKIEGNVHLNKKVFENQVKRKEGKSGRWS